MHTVYLKPRRQHGQLLRDRPACAGLEGGGRMNREELALAVGGRTGRAGLRRLPLQAHPQAQREKRDLNRTQHRLCDVKPLLWLTELLGHLWTLQRGDTDAVPKSLTETCEGLGLRDVVQP